MTYHLAAAEGGKSQVHLNSLPESTAYLDVLSNNCRHIVNSLPGCFQTVQGVSTNAAVCRGHDPCDH